MSTHNPFKATHTQDQPCSHAVCSTISFQCTTYIAGQMTLWLKAEGYSVEQINVYSSGVQAVAIVIGIVATNLVMVYPIWAIFCVIAGTLLFCNISLLVWDIPLGLHCESHSCSRIIFSPSRNEHCLTIIS